MILFYLRIYVYKVLKTVHAELGISKRAVEVSSYLLYILLTNIQYFKGDGQLLQRHLPPYCCRIRTSLSNQQQEAHVECQRSGKCLKVSDLSRRNIY